MSFVQHRKQAGYSQAEGLMHLGVARATIIQVGLHVIADGVQGAARRVGRGVHAIRACDTARQST